MNFKEFYGSFIPILEWKFVEDETDSKNQRNELNIPDHSTFIATDSIGDFIVANEKGLWVVDHDKQGDLDPIFLTDKKDDVARFLKELLSINPLPDEPTLEELRILIKELTSIRKHAPKCFKSNIQESLIDLRQQVQDYKFDRSEAGISLNKSLELREQFHKLLNKPERYLQVFLEYDYESRHAYILGWCTKQDEKIEEVMAAVQSLKSDLEIKIKHIKSYEEYLEYLEKQK